MALKRYVSRGMRFLSIGPCVFRPLRDEAGDQHGCFFETEDPAQQAIVERSGTFKFLEVVDSPELVPAIDPGDRLPALGPEVHDPDDAPDPHPVDGSKPKGGKPAGHEHPKGKLKPPKPPQPRHTRTDLNKMGKGELVELYKKMGGVVPDPVTKQELIDLIDELQAKEG